MIEKDFYRPDELAARLDESVRNVYIWINQDLIRHVHVGKKLKIPRAEFERVLREGIRREGICPKAT
jgi:excisionase family DNA binding protein